MQAIVTSGSPLAFSKAGTEMLRIEKVLNGSDTVLRLSGRIESKHVPELQEQIESGEPPIALDLAEVKLVDVVAVRFLALSEARGIELRDCTLFVREWVRREKALLPGGG